MEHRGFTAVVTSIVLVMLLHVTGSAVNSATLRVGAGEEYATIQAAVDDAVEGDTILVGDGTYTENVVIGKPLILISVSGSASTAVVAANANDHVFRIDAEHVTLSGFTINGATGWVKAGIYLSSSAAYCTITNNRSGTGGGNQNYIGILLWETTGNTVSRNSFKYNYYGIDAFRATDNSLKENACSNNSSDGIFLEESDSNFIDDNDCLNNTNHGISIQNSSFNFLRRNNCTGGQYGIRLNGSDDSLILGTRLFENFCYNNSAYGFYIQDGMGNSFLNNTVLSSGEFAIKIVDSSGNIFSVNNLISSGDSHVSTSSSVDRWYSAAPLWYTYDGHPQTSFLGNYYDDHDHSDGNGDGVTDTDYTLPGVQTDDDRPLAKSSSSSKWDWHVVSSGNETISACGNCMVASSLTITAGLVDIDDGRLTIGGLW